MNKIFSNRKDAYFAGGCFWCTEKIYRGTKGVISVESGYCGGAEASPSYSDVKAQKTMHRETVHIVYDAKKTSFSELLSVYLGSIDPSDAEGQFIDRGRSYTCAIYYTDDEQKKFAEDEIDRIEKEFGKVAIAIEPYNAFYPAEEYHQNYAEKNPDEYEKEYEISGRKNFFEKKAAKDKSESLHEKANIKKKYLFPKNDTASGIFVNMLTAFISLFVNGFGVYLTIRANIGAAPWDVLNLGLSKTFGILYGTASIAVSFLILVIDVSMREAIGIAMIIDALTVGKSVDFFNYIDAVPSPKTLPGSILMTLVGLVILGYTQYFYMRAALGCGPRDTLIVGLTRHMRRIPIGIVSIIVQSLATLTGWLLGGPVGIGTVICALCAGPVMQFAFTTVRFDATGIKHQNILQSFKIMFGKKHGLSGS